MAFAKRISEMESTILYQCGCTERVTVKRMIEGKRKQLKIAINIQWAQPTEELSHRALFTLMN